MSPRGGIEITPAAPRARLPQAYRQITEEVSVASAHAHVRVSTRRIKTGPGGEREKIGGTLLLWPGVAEELLAGKAYMVREGVFDDVDAVLFTQVGNNFEAPWGQVMGTGLVSVEYTFRGESAHSASAPWRGRSALDAVEIMNMAGNMRREHLRPEQRSHYVITDGGDQPKADA